jgi:hypothetical protein
MPLLNILANSSNELLLKALKYNSRYYFPKKRLLSDKNIFLDDATTKVNSSLSRAKKVQLKQYVSISSIIHFVDSWKYLSNAINTLLHNNSTTTLHLGYYAELRSVMSMMATQGIGNFDKIHVWYNNRGENFEASNGNNVGATHGFAKNWINGWPNDPSSANIIFENIYYKNISLKDWLSKATSAPLAVLSSWLQHWNMDFDLRKDQDIRNECSYRPHFKFSQLDLKNITQKVMDIWQTIEPIIDTENLYNHKYLELDKFLVRKALEYVFLSTHGTNPSGSRFEFYINKIISDLGLSSDITATNFLLRNIHVSDPFLFDEAQISYVHNSEYILNPLPVISRAFFLLRLNNCLLDDFLKKSNVPKSDLEFLLNKICYSSGLIPNQTSYNLLDVYTEVTESFAAIDFTDINLWSSPKKCTQKYSSEFSLLAQFERASILGLAI